MAKKETKLMFYELAEGEFSNMVQKDFDEAQAIAATRGVKVKISVEITIHPENREHPGTGQVEFKSAVKAPQRASIRYITEVSKEGQIVDRGIRQTGMQFGRNADVGADGGEGGREAA